jgi:GNAT superfamily N-acetyltransferase
VRELPPEEWPRLAAYEPFATGGLPSAGHWRILVAEVGPDLVAFVCLFDAVHLEPLWVAPEYRLRPKTFGHLLQALWAEAHQLLTDLGVGAVFATVDQSNLPRGGRFLEHLGFHPAPARLYVATVPDRQPVPERAAAEGA